MKLYSPIARIVSRARMMVFAMATLGMIANSHAKDAQNCPIRETEGSRREAFGALFGGCPQNPIETTGTFRAELFGRGRIIFTMCCEQFAGTRPRSFQRVLVSRYWHNV